MSLFKEILFGKKITLYSALPASELLKRLADRTCEPIRFKVYGASKSYVGYINDNSFSLRLQHKYRSGLSPKVLGFIEAAEKGSSVFLHIRVNPVSLFFLFSGIFLMIAIAIALLSLSQVDELIDVIMMVPLVIILLILLLAILKVQYEMESIVYNLSALFDIEKN